MVVILDRCKFAVITTLAVGMVAGVFLLQCRAQNTRRGTVKTDLKMYPATAPAALPRAGGKMMDPIFGTEVMRATDESGGGNAGTAYSYMPTFNRDNTRILVMRDGVGAGEIYDFDPVAFTLGRKRSISPLPGGGGIRGEDAIWSSTEPNVLYAHTDGGAQLWSYDVTRGTFKLIADLSRRLGRGEFLYQMSKSEDNDVFAFTRRGPPPAYAFLGYLVYKASTNAVLAKASINQLDEVQIDKSGRYLIVKLDPKYSPGVIRTHILDLQSGTQTSLTWGAPDYSCGHSDNGQGVVYGGEDTVGGITKRYFNDPHRSRTILPLPYIKGVGLGVHLSALAQDEAWIEISTFGAPTSPQPLKNELIQVATDGSGRVKRWAHHHSVYRVYEDSPRANISRDGRFIAFTSNWGGRTRRDLFIARIEPPPQTRQRRATSTNQVRPQHRN